MWKKVFSKIHLWLSVPFGLIITLTCFSGAMLVFESEVMEIVNRDMYRVEVSGNTITVGQAAALVEPTLKDGVKITGVTVPDNPERAWKVNLSKPKRAAVYVNQYTGEITGKYERAPFFTFMFRLHRWLLDSMKPGETVFWGKIIVGVSTLMFVFVLISGIVIWMPKSLKGLKNRLKISVGRGWKRFWMDLHVAGGIYACLFLLAMALTGLTWSFSWYRTGFYKVFGVETNAGGGHGAAPKGGNSAPAEQKNTGHGRADSKGPVSVAGNGAAADTFIADKYALWQAAYLNVAALRPESREITVSDGSVSVPSGAFGNGRAADRYTFDTVSGKITGCTLYKDTPASGKIRGWIYAVHVGSWGGMVTRIIAFLSALLGASLPITGYWIWLRRTVRRKRS